MCFGDLGFAKRVLQEMPLALHKPSQSSMKPLTAIKHMKTMNPMEPMKLIKAMKPMKPLKAMKPMETDGIPIKPTNQSN